MSIKDWNDHDYENAKARHARLQLALKKAFADADWRTLKPMKDEMEALGTDVKRYEKKLLDQHELMLRRRR